MRGSARRFRAEFVVATRDGYIGKSTAGEITSTAAGKPVEYRDPSTRS